MTITLTNATRRMKVVNLPHDVYCAALGTCACIEIARGRRVASSLTLPAGSTTHGLEEAVLRVPDVARDVQAGELRVRRDPPPPKQPPDSPMMPHRQPGSAASEAAGGGQPDVLRSETGRTGRKKVR